MNASNTFRPNFLLDFESGEAYFGAGGIHLAADPAETAITVKNGTDSIKLSKTGISSRINDAQFSVDSNGLKY